LKKKNFIGQGHAFAASIFLVVENPRGMV